LSLFVLLLSALLVPACGGDDGGDGSGGSERTQGGGAEKAEVVRRADRICGTATRNAQRTLNVLARGAGGIERINLNSTALGVMLQGDVLYVGRALSEHRKLEPPAEGRGDFQRFVDGEERILAALRDAEQRLARGPEALGAVGPKLQRAGVASSRAAGRYGLSKCPPVGSFVEFVSRRGGD
jgi:hypothetical protein